MLRFLFWVIRFQIFIVGVAVSIRNVIPPLVPFSKNIDMSESGISSNSIFVILSIASQLKPGALK